MQEGTKKQFYIIFGRSGCGKGTQSQLLKKKLEAEGYGNVLYVTTGAGFREFISGSSYAAQTSRDITNNGGLNPSFLAIWNWSNIFIKHLSGTETVILDGAPRRIEEVAPLQNAVSFFGYTRTTIIYLDVSEAWAMDKLVSRGREDDNELHEQERKMKWFNEDMLPCVEFYKNDPSCTYVHINGEQSVEDVHKEITEKLHEIRH